MALTGIRIDNFINIMWPLNAWGYDILISETSFQKSNIDWPQQPPIERVSAISKKLDFWWSIQQIRAIIGQLGIRDDPFIRTKEYKQIPRYSSKLMFSLFQDRLFTVHLSKVALTEKSLCWEYIAWLQEHSSSLPYCIMLLQYT